MRLLKRFGVLMFGLVMTLAMSSVVRADAVTDWNAIAIQIIVNAPCPAAPCANPPVHPGATSLLDSAMVQAAVYDAVESITGRFRPYAVHVPGASGSTAAAVAKAAHDVLVNRFPSLTGTLDTTYHAYLAAPSLSESDPGVAPLVLRLRLASLPCAPTTAAFHRPHRHPSRVAPLPASGAQLRHINRDHPRPIRPCWHRGSRR
jgi:hypothetical protein